MELVDLLATGSLILTVIVAFILFNQLKVLRLRLDQQEQKLSAVSQQLEIAIAELSHVDGRSRRHSEQSHLAQSERHDLQQLCQLQQELLETLQHKVQLLESKSSEDKLYLRAKKLLALGADVEEIMAECQLSHTEVELLVSMQGK